LTCIVFTLSYTVIFKKISLVRLSLVFQKITPKLKRRGRRRGKRRPNNVGVGPTSGQNLSYTRPQGADPPSPSSKRSKGR
jgi:hypothetical protein